MSVLKCWLTVLFFSSIFVFPVQAASIHVKITSDKKAYSVTSEAEFLKSTVTVRDIGQFMSAFKPLDLSQLTLNSRPDNVYWYRFTVSNYTHERLYAMLGLVGHSKAALYEWDGRKASLLGAVGMDVPGKDLFMPITRPIFRLNLSGTQPKTYLLRTERLWVRDLGLVIYPEYALLANMESYSVSLGLVVGILFCAFLFQICFFFLSWQIDYLWLAGQLFFGLVYTLVGNGFISGYVSLPIWLNPTLVYYSCICLTGLLSLQFQRTFLKLDVYGTAFIRKGYLVFQGGYGLFIGIAIWGPPAWFDWQTPFTGLVAAFCVYAICIVYRQGYKPALYFLFIQLLPASFIPLLAFQQQGQMGGISHTLFLVASLQSILFSLVVAYKVKKYKDDAYYLIRLHKDTLETVIAERTQKLQAEKKRADHQSERLQLALRELNHRVKNNLAVVSSLLKLQSKSLSTDDAREVFQESRQRIDAMALIHRQLYQSAEITTIDMPTYIASLAESLCEAYGFTPFLNLQLELDLHPLTLPVENAVPLGLILNEVLTNAFKYGLSKTKMPRLKITLQRNDSLCLEVHDNGPGINLTYWNQSKLSFGRRLIDALSKQVNGHYDLDGTTGTCFRLWMPTVSEYTVLI